MSDRSQCRAANLANPFGDVIGCGEKLIALFVQQQMVVAKVRPRNMPMEVLGLQIESDYARKMWAAIQKLQSALKDSGFNPR